MEIHIDQALFQIVIRAALLSMSCLPKRFLMLIQLPADGFRLVQLWMMDLVAVILGFPGVVKPGHIK